MNDRMKTFYMRIAYEAASMSRAKRLQVGSVIVKNNNIISFSWNGTPYGWNNTCETKQYMTSDASAMLGLPGTPADWPYQDNRGHYKLKTKPEVIHAERNAIDKLAKSSSEGAEGAIMFITHSPCMECSKSIYSAGIKEVYYAEDYRTNDGISFLKKANVMVKKYAIEH